MDVRASCAAPPDQVWAVLSDIAGWPTWTDTVTAAEPLRGDQAPGVGAAYVVRQPRLPKATWTITDWQPGRAFTWTASGPGLTSTATHELTPTPMGGAEIRLSLRWDGPLRSLARLVYGRLTARYLNTEARGLAARAEQGR